MRRQRGKEAAQKPIPVAAGDQPSRDDEGFSLIEVVVAMMIFAVFCSVALGLMIRSTDVTRGNLQRTAAANLAAEQIQIARGVDVDSIANVTRTQVVANTTYTIKQTIRYLVADSTSTACSGSGGLAYKLVTVQVSWPVMGSIQPVRADTLKAYAGSSGGLAVAVTGADGTGKPNLVITLTSDGSTATTDDAGCAIFPGLDPGSYGVTINQPGYAGLTNAQLTSKASLGVTEGTLTRASVSYDQARSVNVAIDSPVAGALVPATLPLRVSSGSLSETGYPACPGSGAPSSACATAPTATTTGVVKSLYPAIYNVKLGACTETTPSTVAVDMRPVTADGSTVSVPLGAWTIRVVSSAQPGGINSRSVTFNHASQTSGCTSGESYATTSVPAGSTMLLPYGTWTVTVPVLNAAGVAVGSSTATATLGPSNRTASSVITVAL